MGEKTVKFVDTTFRDGAQSLWAMRMTYGMMDAVAEEMDQAGFAAMEVPAANGHIKLNCRAFKENTWDIMRMLKKKLSNTKKAIGTGLALLNTFAGPAYNQLSVMKLYLERMTEATGVSRHHMIANTRDEMRTDFPKVLEFCRGLGHEIIIAFSYAISPRHTDEYYANLTRECLKWKPDGIYIKDQGGLLTPERIKTLIPAIIMNANGIPVELHSHCVSTYAPTNAVEAIKLGVSAIHTCVPPLAFGSSHPSPSNVAQNARKIGYTPEINLEPLKVVEERLTMIAKLENMPIGAPLEYDHGNYIHMVPGGVISNLRNQLGQLGIAHKLDEVLDETVQVTKDLGYPIMITPHSQFIVSQAAINVAVGERYKEIIDAMTDFALGVYGIEDAGVPYMDPDVKDRFLSTPYAKKRAKELEEATEELSIEEIRRKYGMTGVSDEEFLTYYIMQGEEDIKKMRAAGSPRTFYTGKEPLGLLLHELSKNHNISRLEIRR